MLCVENKQQQPMTKDVMLLDVQRVPGLTYNLVSVRAVLDRGKLVEFGYDGCAVKTRHGKVVAFGRQEDKLFMLNMRKKSGRPRYNNDGVGWGGRHAARSTCNMPHYNYNMEEPRRYSALYIIFRDPILRGHMDIRTDLHTYGPL